MCFSKTDLVMRARNKIYHVECFRCAVCARQLTRGDEFVLKFDDLFCKVCISERYFFCFSVVHLIKC